MTTSTGFKPGEVLCIGSYSHGMSLHSFELYMKHVIVPLLDRKPLNGSIDETQTLEDGEEFELSKAIIDGLENVKNDQIIKEYAIEYMDLHRGELKMAIVESMSNRALSVTIMDGEINYISWDRSVREQIYDSFNYNGYI